MKKKLFAVMMLCSAVFADTVLLDSSRDSDMFAKIGQYGVDWDMDWREPPELKNGVWSRSGGFCFFSKPFDVDLRKTYTISGEFRVLNASMPIQGFAFGINPVDGENKTIMIHRVLAVKEYPKLARLAVPALDGDTEIILTDAGWKIPYPHWVLAFDAKPNFSDLPSKVTSGRMVLNGIRKLPGGNVAVTLTAPLQGSFPAGTGVRMHSDGPTYLYTGSGVQPGSSWVKWQGTISGVHVSGNIGPNHWYPGTCKARLVLRCFDAGMADATLEFRNIQVISKP